LQDSQISEKVQCMIRSRSIVLACCIPLLAGCASAPIVLDPVGPGSANSLRTGGQGVLQVFTATDDHYDGKIRFFPHQSYLIYTEDGQKLKSVSNSNGLTDETPAIVPLAPGNYVIKAPAEAYGRISVPVVIKRGWVTTVHLERGWKPDTNSEADLVRIPGGYPVGWKVEPAAQGR